MHSLTIDIVSDPVCPWCFIGKRRLERALEQRPELDVTIRWLPFQLSPELPREGIDRREYMARKFGEEKAAIMLGSLSETGRDEGIEFQLKDGARSPNTLSAHVLLHWAFESPDVDQSALAEKLFAAHFSDCEDIGDLDVLARIAGEAGMDSDLVRSNLAAGIDEDTVLEQIEQATANSITGVPFFILNNTHALSGAQPTEIILQALDQLGASSDP